MFASGLKTESSVTAIVTTMPGPNLCDDNSQPTIRTAAWHFCQSKFIDHSHADHMTDCDGDPERIYETTHNGVNHTPPATGERCQLTGVALRKTNGSSLSGKPKTSRRKAGNAEGTHVVKGPTVRKILDKTSAVITPLCAGSGLHTLCAEMCRQTRYNHAAH